MLAQAVLDLFPGATFGIGPPVEDGFYYDFELPAGPDGTSATFTPDDLDRIDARMREIIAESQPFVRDELSADAARAVFAGHRYKLEIIDNASTDPMSATESGLVRTYENPPAKPKDVPPFAGYPGFIDLCRGPHVPATDRFLGHFKLMRVAGAYWKGDEKNPQLQRIYGTAWATKQELADHLHRLEEAEKRDHRKLGAELDLFSFPELLGGGLAVWHPKGAIVRKLMEDYSRERHLNGGYEFVYTPHLANGKLFETNGPPRLLRRRHVSADGDGQRRVLPQADELPDAPARVRVAAALLPRAAACASTSWATCTATSGPAPSTVSCASAASRRTTATSSARPSRPPARSEASCSFVLSVLRAFGFDDFEADLATKPTEKFVGTDEGWNTAIDALRAAVEAEGIRYEVDEGGGAFYGPKIDIKVKDAIGRRWQLSTIQYDFNMAERLELEYVGADNQRHRPVMIHRALFGSIERFFGVLVEHFAGAFPAWLAPVQARVLPVRDDHDAYASRIVDRLKAEGFRADLVEADEPLGGADPQGQAREAAVRARGRRRRRRRRNRRRQRAGERTTRARRHRRRLRRAPRRRGAGPNMSLDRLWAGWRAAYVSAHSAGTADANATEGGSVFSRILASGHPDEETRHRAPGPHVLRHPQPVPVRVGPPARDAPPRGRRPPRAHRRRARRAVVDGARRGRCHHRRLFARRHQRRRQPRRGLGRRRAGAPPRPRAATMARRLQLHDGHRRDARAAGVVGDQLAEAHGRLADLIAMAPPPPRSISEQGLGGTVPDMRAWRIGVVLAVAISIGAVSQAARADGPTELTVTPYQELDDQGPVTVHITGTGFLPNRFLEVRQTGHYGGWAIAFVTTDASGAFEIDADVQYRRTFGDLTLTCDWSDTERCVVLAGHQVDGVGGASADHDLFFAGHDTRTPPTTTPPPTTAPPAGDDVLGDVTELLCDVVETVDEVVEDVAGTPVPVEEILPLCPPAPAP